MTGTDGKEENIKTLMPLCHGIKRYCFLGRAAETPVNIKSQT